MRTFAWLSLNTSRLRWIISMAVIGCAHVPSPCWAQFDVPPADHVEEARAGHLSSRPLAGDLPASVMVPPASEAEQRLSKRDRTAWAVESSVGMKSLGAGVVSAAWGVVRDSPDEYGANWRGFGKRYALRLSGVAIGNSVEAGLGALWGEDPRYERAGDGPFWTRVAHAGKWTVLSQGADGRMRPAYARGIGIVSNNFITNAWRVESDRSVADALSRSGVGIASRYVSNLFDEFWPEIRRVVLRR